MAQMWPARIEAARQGMEQASYDPGNDQLAPAAVAAIGTLPLPVIYRSIIIHMERHDACLDNERKQADLCGQMRASTAP
jgi:hypothetical protein